MNSPIKYGLLVIGLLFLPSVRAGAQITIGPNFRIYPSPVTQTEVFITHQPGNSQILLASANTISFLPFFISEGIYVSVDGGITWNGSDTCSGNPLQFHGGDPGIAINKNGCFLLTRLGRDPFAGLYSHYSTDRGTTWSDQRTISTDDLERAALATDPFPNSPFYGRTYATWVRFAPPYPVFSSYTDDGQNWSVPLQVNNPPWRCAGGDARTGPSGDIHLVWAGVSAVSPFTEERVGHAVSTDGGGTWRVSESAFLMSGIQGLLPEKSNIRVNGLPRLAIDQTCGPRQGWLYVVTTEKNLSPAGSDPDIILHRSTDRGITWSGGIRVNQDPLNNGKIQYFPAIAVDDEGGINVVHYDDRYTTSDSCSVSLSRSADGGNSWAELEISDHHFQPLPIGGLGQGYQGDNIDIDANGPDLWPLWMDNSSGIYQIWTARIQFPLQGTGDHTPLPNGEDHLIVTAYPNPFNSSTTIEYLLKRPENVILMVTDLAGKLVKELVREKQPEGYYRVRFEAGHLSSGVYIAHLQAGNSARSYPLILIK